MTKETLTASLFLFLYSWYYANMDTKHSPLVAASAVLSVALILGVIVVSQTIYKVRALSNVITVTGSAERVVTSDTVKWTSTISRNAGTGDLKVASAKLSTDLTTVKKALSDAGVQESELRIDAVVVTPLCASQNNVTYDRHGNQSCGSITGYGLSQKIIVESGDVTTIQTLAQELHDRFIAGGLIFSSQSLEYYYNKLADLRVELLSEATNDAQKRAAEIAKSTGASLGKLQNASMGVFQVAAKNSTEISDYGVYDTSSLEKKVTAVVRGSFSLL